MRRGSSAIAPATWLLPVVACACGARTKHAPLETIGDGPASDSGTSSTPSSTPLGTWSLPVRLHEDISCSKGYLASYEGGAAVLCQQGTDSSGLQSVYLDRFDASGALLGTQELKLPGSDSWLAQGLVADQGRAFYAAIRAATPDPRSTPTPPPEDPRPILGLARIELDGTVTWARSYQASDAAIRGMVVDRDGSLLLTGRFGQSLDFGGQPLHSHAPNTGDRWLPDIFVARLDPSGNRIWSAQFGAWCPESGHGIALTEKGDIVVVGTGLFEETATCQTRTTTAWSIALLDKDGSLRWTRVFNDLPALPVLLTASGPGVSVVGNLPGLVPNAQVAGTGATVDDIWIENLDTEGKDIASKHFGGNYDDVISGFAIDHQGNFILAGYTSTLGTPPPLDFGGGRIPDKAGSAAFVAKLDKLGAHVWTRSMFQKESLESPVPLAIALTPNDEIYVASLAPNGDQPWSTRITTTDFYLGKLTP